MKKRTFVAAFFAVFAFSACSENSKENATAETHEQHGEAAAEEPGAGKVVVEAPDYTSVAEPMKRNVSQLLDEYLKMKDAMVASDATAAQNSAKSILTMAKAMPVATLQGEQKEFAEERVEEVRQGASKISETNDLGTQRQQLELISEATFALSKAFGASDQELYYQHCPMAFNDKGAYWLSTNNEIRNPYFGDKMLKCGSTEEVYNKN